MSFGLTAQQSALLIFIKGEIKAGRQPPTVLEMADHLGMTSKGPAHALLKALEARGHIRQLSRQPRAIELVEREALALVRVPEIGLAEITIAPGLTLAQTARVDQTSGDPARKGVHDIQAPVNTIATAGGFAVAAPFLVPRYGEREGQEPRTRSVEVPAPVVVTTANGGSLAAVLCVKNNHGDKPMYGMEEPAHTVVAGGTHHAVVAAHLSRQFGASVGSDIKEPIGTTTAGGGGKSALVAAFFAQHNGDRAPKPGRSAEDPVSTITSAGGQQQVCAAFLAQHNTGLVGHAPEEPVSTIVGKGCTQGVVQASLLSHSYGSNTAAGAGDPAEPLKTVTAGGFHAAEVRAFLVKYYGEGSVDQAAGDPLHTVPTRDRFGLVTTTIDGEPYAIVDIGMRMLSPRELFRAQGFPDSYVIDRGVGPDGAEVRLTKTAQVRMCGNSVCPPLAEALVRANFAFDQVARPRPTPQRPALPSLFDEAAA